MSEAQSEGPQVEPTAEREWWDDPSLPWKHKPSRADIICFSWLGAVAIYSLVMMPLRPALLASAPHLLASLGSWTGTILIGAKAALGDPWWPLVWLLGTFGLIKFDWIYWWAGRLWGRHLIEAWSGRSDRARRINERVERFTRKYETWAIAVTFLPIPLPRGVIFAVLGEAGTSLRKFLTVSIASSFISTGAYLWIGYSIGAPAVATMDAYGRYLWYVSLAILVVMVANYWWKQRKQAAGS
ncbi:MAG: VTT domain-containing protein [Propionibacteriaceae bacterium]|nr:VTT domain-containing protein [Propionibacteriaceae bacterium]